MFSRLKTNLSSFQRCLFLDCRCRAKEEHFSGSLYASHNYDKLHNRIDYAAFSLIAMHIFIKDFLFCRQPNGIRLGCDSHVCCVTDFFGSFFGNYCVVCEVIKTLFNDHVWMRIKALTEKICSSTDNCVENLIYIIHFEFIFEHFIMNKLKWHLCIKSLRSMDGWMMWFMCINSYSHGGSDRFFFFGKRMQSGNDFGKQLKDMSFSYRKLI